ncbi:MAG: hypothetical protein IH888_05860 [Planctomycetes bacterium]|nr:hypothetical protein [Planctomycetota bacterium]
MAKLSGLIATGLLVVTGGCAGGPGGQRSARSRGPVADVWLPVLKSVNRMCPISGMPVNPDVRTVNYRGAEIGFCCDRCPMTWKIFTDPEKIDLVAKVAVVLPPAPRRR